MIGTIVKTVLIGAVVYALATYIPTTQLTVRNKIILVAAVALITVLVDYMADVAGRAKRSFCKCEEQAALDLEVAALKRKAEEMARVSVPGASGASGAPGVSAPLPVTPQTPPPAQDDIDAAIRALRS